MGDQTKNVTIAKVIDCNLKRLLRYTGRAGDLVARALPEWGQACAETTADYVEAIIPLQLDNFSCQSTAIPSSIPIYDRHAPATGSILLLCSGKLKPQKKTKDGKNVLTEAVKTWEERKKSREVSMPATIPEGIRREGY